MDSATVTNSEDYLLVRDTLIAHILPRNPGLLDVEERVLFPGVLNLF